MKAIQTLLILMVAATMVAQNDLQTPTVDVSGEGVVKVVPDEVTINVRVENTGENTKNLKQQNDATINEVLKFLKSKSISDKDVKTEYINLNKNYDYNTKTYTFAANQALSIKLHSLKNYEEIMKGLMDTGINRIDGVDFESSNKEQLQAQARKKAVENARMKATEYAGALDQKIGKAVKISEFTQVSGPQPMYKMTRESASSDSVQTISPGEMEIRTTVNVSFILY